jgi:transcription antitermination protein NusB
MTDLPHKPFSMHARVRARRNAVQAYYQWLINKQPMNAVIEEFMNERTELRKADKEYFRDLLQGMNLYSEELDNALSPFLDRALDEINPVERAILKLGMYELIHHPELPWRVIMNETVELAKMFGAEQSHKYINGVLDKAARKIRDVEISNS